MNISVNVLIVDDDYVDATWLAKTVEDHGAIVFGPFPTVIESISIDPAKIDVAFIALSIEAGGADALAAHLLARNVKTYLISGTGASTIPLWFKQVPFLTKPFELDIILRALDTPRITAFSECGQL